MKRGNKKTVWRVQWKKQALSARKSPSGCGLAADKKPERFGSIGKKLEGGCAFGLLGSNIYRAKKKRKKKGRRYRGFEQTKGREVPMDG